MKRFQLIYFFFIMGVFFQSLGCKHRTPPVKKEIVAVVEEMDDKISDHLKSTLDYAIDNVGKISDSMALTLPQIVYTFYEGNDFHNLWSKKEHWSPLADSMIEFIANSRYYGLFPDDYHFKDISVLRKRFDDDTLARKDAVFWTKADLLLSDAFMKTVKDLHEGRMVPDSQSIITKESMVDSLFIMSLKTAKDSNIITSILKSVEPNNRDYKELRSAMKNFVDSMDTVKYTYLVFPQKDSIKFIQMLQKRLIETGNAEATELLPDSTVLKQEIKKYQSGKSMKADGKVTSKLITSLNTTDVEKFKRIAITLDRYKSLAPLPPNYIWVNMPSFYLNLWDHDTLVLTSKVIVGKPDTRTPILTSQITDMVTYPQWTIPESIIKKDILPALKQDPGYLARKGFNLVDSKGETVDPYSVDWSKYKNGIPWNVQQGSGDDNALGIFKFNFNNPYNVYLHDTNQRYLFKNSFRALSHGCVRVQNWQGLANFIAKNDSLNFPEGRKISYNSDSIKTWLTSKSRKRIMLKTRLPLYIGYYTCVGKDDKVIFYDDIYGEDKFYTEKFFANK